MGITEANIYLDSPYNIYYAGQTINGRIEYVFDSPKKVRGIHVSFRGDAHTEWTQTKQRGTEYIEVLYKGKQKTFSFQYYILGSKTGDAPIEVPAGKQVYQFTCKLPTELPCSFEGRYGYVRYTVKVTLDRPWKFDQETTMTFTVIDAVDLNSYPSCREPIHMQMEKTFCCFCCASPPLSVDVRAPVSGYCPGQSIPVQIDVDNKSNNQVELVKVMIIKVECVVSHMHMNLSDKKEITIGTVPLEDAASAPSSSQPEPAVSPGQPAQPSISQKNQRQHFVAVRMLGRECPGETKEGVPGGWVMPGLTPAQPSYSSLYPTLSLTVVLCTDSNQNELK